jgi:hypothetical protein
VSPTFGCPGVGRSVLQKAKNWLKPKWNVSPADLMKEACCIAQIKGAKVIQQTKGKYEKTIEKNDININK